ncbi:phage antirepressor KilAC domain-containing protein (plasmid) [Staphylococcus aureus]|nr:phage antirepressor KilAC domain-containing protein [Staphylococcus aureus]
MAEWIGIVNTSQMINKIDQDEKALYTMYRVDGSTNKQWFLTENGMYEILMQSRKPLAKQFKREVKEILKDIRKHGMYLTNNTVENILNDPGSFITVLTEYQKEKEQRLLAEQQVKTLKPKADYYDLILQCDSLMTATQIAKDYGMTAYKFNNLLKELKVQYKQSGQWLLYSQYANEGYTHSQTYTYTDRWGNQGFSLQTKWTQKGRIFLYEFLKANGIVPAIEDLKSS